MAARPSQSRAHASGGDRNTDSPPSLDDFAQPDDQGLALEELSQAYAALLAKGSDPYSDASANSAHLADEPPQKDIAAGARPGTSNPLTDEPLAVVYGEDDAACEIAPRSILEAILFVGHPTGEPLTSERIAGLMRGVRPAEIDDLVQELNEEYAAASAPYAIHSVGPGYQLGLRAEFGPLRDAFYGRIREARLSAAAIDVLAIVAYHQPVTAEEIERQRGKPSGAILAQLLRRDLLAVVRPSAKKAKPQYRTTSRFLDLFSLSDISELPRSHEIERDL
jgi:segregation and condensation protein B